VPQLYVMPLDGGEPERMTDLPLGVASPRWFPDGRTIAFVVPLYADAMTVAGTAELHQTREDDPVKAAVTENRVYRIWDTWITDDRVHHIFALNLESGEMMDLLPRWRRWMDPMELSGTFNIAPDGREIAFSACRSKPPYDPALWGAFTAPVPARIHAKAKAGRVTELRPGKIAHAEHPVYSPDGRTIIYGIQREFDFYADRVRLVAFNRRSGRHTVLTEDWDRSAAGWTFGDDPKKIIFAAETEARIAFFSLDLPRALRDPGATRPRELVRGGSFTAPRVAGKRIFTARSTLTTPPEVFSCKVSGGDARYVTAFTDPIMKTIQPGTVGEWIFDGADGDPVQMFILYPPGVKKTSGKPTKRLPLVHLIHGGPHGTFGDQWHWRWCALAFASRGYAVALVNFHGSTSWGQEFAACIHGRWGDQPYTDIMRATDELIDSGIADPKRIAATGGSYGGYLVSWIAAQTDRFACIVNHAGVCDLQTQYASDFTQGRQRSMGGEPWDRVEGMDRYSPMRHASGFKTPMLVVHGERDYRVPYAQGLQIYNVYKARKLPARLVCYPDENHWILKPKNSLHWYGEFVGWLDRWMGKGKRS
jgi:dipeptidyl aminopeptidase/acylaminoacyl peptidase